MKNVDHSLVKATCEKRKQELKDSVKVRWSYMRINLALSAPEEGKKDTLLEISLEKLSSDEFKKRLEQRKPLQSSKGVILTNKNQGILIVFEISGFYDMKVVSNKRG